MVHFEKTKLNQIMKIVFFAPKAYLRWLHMVISLFIWRALVSTIHGNFAAFLVVAPLSNPSKYNSGRQNYSFEPALLN